MKKRISLYILIPLLNLTIFASCNTPSSKSERKELSQVIEKVKHTEQPKPTTVKFKPDTSIGSINLLNSTNTENYLGKNIIQRLNLANDELPNLSVLSNDSKQRLTIYFHPGSRKNEFSEFKVNFNQKEKGEHLITENEFISETDIKLGMTIADFITIKGKPDSKTMSNTNTLHYRIDDFDKSDFLKKYNMPVYYADYEFQNDLLIEFKFGFEYP